MTVLHNNPIGRFHLDRPEEQTVLQVKTQLVADTTDADVAVPTRRREDVIRFAVLQALGRQPELIRVSVSPLWGDQFRVNVWAMERTGAAIPDSYFVTASEDGTIRKSDPPIHKRY